MEDCSKRRRYQRPNSTTASISALAPSQNSRRTEKVTDYGKAAAAEDAVKHSLIASERGSFVSVSLEKARAGDPILAEARISDGSTEEESRKFGDSVQIGSRKPDDFIEKEKRASDCCVLSEGRCDGTIGSEILNSDDPIGTERRKSDGSVEVETGSMDDSITVQLRRCDDSVDRVMRDASVEAGSRNLGVSIEVETRTSASLENSAARMKGLSSNGDGVVKKPKKKPANVWAKSSSRKGGKRSGKKSKRLKSITKSVSQPNLEKEPCVYIIPARNQDKMEDGPDMPVVLSRFHKSEKIELSEDRLTAGSTKGYRMVRATRGITTGAWYFEILVEKLGRTGHTRLGWSTQKGELQAPVGFDIYSYGYRDIDGSKVHTAVRELYGEPYVEGDVIGFYINLPNGEALAPKSASLVSYRGQPYVVDQIEEPPKVVSGSEIAFFRNGVFQGIAFKDIFAGRYFPAASMYTLPNEPNCTVRFNFGPAFRFPLLEMGNDDRPAPQALCHAPHCGLDFGPTWISESQAINAGQTLEPYKTGEAGLLP